MTNIDIVVTHSLQEAEDRCLLLLHEILGNIKKSQDLSLEFAKSILEYCMITLNLPHLSLVLDEKYKDSEGCLIGTKVIINNKSLNIKKPAGIAKLADTLIHEPNHLKIKNDNKNITKDENGNLRGEYLPSSHDKMVLLFLNKFLPYCDVYSLMIGLYVENMNEVRTREKTRDMLLSLINKYEERYHDNKKAINEMKKETESSFKNAQFNEYVDYLNIYRDKIIKCAKEYQKSFALDPMNDTESKMLLKVARTLHINHETDRKLLHTYIDRGDVDNAILLLNNLSFKNSPEDIEDVLNLLNGTEKEIYTALERFDDNVIEKYISKYTHGL